jgi:hypothetical protein
LQRQAKGGGLLFVFCRSLIISTHFSDRESTLIAFALKASERSAHNSRRLEKKMINLLPFFLALFLSPTVVGILNKNSPRFVFIYIAIVIIYEPRCSAHIICCFLCVHLSGTRAHRQGTFRRRAAPKEILKLSTCSCD